VLNYEMNVFGSTCNITVVLLDKFTRHMTIKDLKNIQYLF